MSPYHHIIVLPCHPTIIVSSFHHIIISSQSSQSPSSPSFPSPASPRLFTPIQVHHPASSIIVFIETQIACNTSVGFRYHAYVNELSRMIHHNAPPGSVTCIIATVHPCLRASSRINHHEVHRNSSHLHLLNRSPLSKGIIPHHSSSWSSKLKSPAPPQAFTPV